MSDDVEVLPGISVTLEGYDPAGGMFRQAARQTGEATKSGITNWLKGRAAGFVGAPADLWNLTAPMRGDYRGRQMGAGAEDVGNMLRADTESLAFKAGTVGLPGLEDIAMKSAAALPLLAVARRPALADQPVGAITTPGAKTSTMARRVGTTGQYRGAPRGTNSPQKLGALRNRLKAAMVEGVPGRLWYDRSSKAAMELTAGRPGLRDKYVGNIAITSADTAVPSNAGFAIKGYNQLMAGHPVATGRYPSAMGAKIETIGRGEDIALTDKVGPFFEANRVDPLNPAQIRPTNDLWMARAFGYTQKDPKSGEFVEWSSGLGEAQHRFMDEEINRLVDLANKEKLGGFDDWTPERVQAAIWVSTKARREGTSIERAATDFATELDARTVNITSESAPAESLQHMQGVYGEPAGVSELSAQHAKAFTDEAGRNVFSTHAGALTRPQVEGQGYYMGDVNPVSVNRMLGSTETGKATIDPASREIAETVGSIEGMVKGQETVGYNFLRPAKKAADRNAAVGPLRDVAEVQRKLDDAFGGSVIATPSEEGVRYLVIDDVPKDWQKKLKSIVGSDIEWRQNSGGLIGNVEFSGYKPSKYLETINPAVAERMDPITRWSADAAEAIDTEMAKTVADPGVRSEVLQRTRQALSKGGIPEVRRLVEAGVLPAVVLAVLAGIQLDAGQNALIAGET